jgi:hypothetical protein
MMEAAGSCEVSEDFFQIEWHHILKDTNLQYMGLTEAIEGGPKNSRNCYKNLFTILTQV